METNQIKLTDQELQTIEDIRTKYMNLTMAFGQLKIEQMVIKTQLQRFEELDTQFSTEYSALQKEEESFTNTIFQKYGDGEVDAETGIFTPVKTSV